MLKRGLIFSAGIMLVILLIGFYFRLNYNYVFSPFTFVKDEVTYLSWNEYKKPLQIEYSIKDNKDLQWQVKTINDAEEVSFVFRELKKGLNKEKKLLNLSSGFNRKWIVDVRRLSDETIVLHLEGLEGRATATLGYRDTTVVISEELKNLFDKRLLQAQQLE